MDFSFSNFYKLSKSSSLWLDHFPAVLGQSLHLFSFVVLGAHEQCKLVIVFHNCCRQNSEVSGLFYSQFSVALFGSQLLIIHVVFLLLCFGNFCFYHFLFFPALTRSSGDELIFCLVCTVFHAFWTCCITHNTIEKLLVDEVLSLWNLSRASIRPACTAMTSGADHPNWVVGSTGELTKLQKLTFQGTHAWLKVEMPFSCLVGLRSGANLNNENTRNHFIL